LETEEETQNLGTASASWVKPVIRSRHRVVLVRFMVLDELPDIRFSDAKKTGN